MIELIVYLAIVAISLTTIVLISHNLIEGNIKSRAQREIVANARNALNLISQKIRNADNLITAASTFNVHPGVLNLDYPGSGTDQIFDTYTRDITLPNGIIVNIRKLRFKDGAAEYQDLTNDRVSVSNFVIKNLTRVSEPENVNIELTLRQINPGGDDDYNNSISLETAISLRK